MFQAESCTIFAKSVIIIISCVKVFDNVLFSRVCTDIGVSLLHL